jgi:DNA (cytosine-5)-methyltransferase 1
MQNVADLFCGAGGTSTGLLQAAKELNQNVHLVAINHWELAISTHSENHPNVDHFNSDLQNIDPRKVVPSGKLRLLVASPECTHFSRARGGKPMSKQSRASVKYVLRWVQSLDVEDVLIENVPDFQDWGPLHRTCTCGAGVKAEKHLSKCHYEKPIQKRKGEYFYRFLRKLEAIGYTVDHRVLNAADYGDPTTRKRLFIIARKHKAMKFPEPTHHKNGGNMFGSLPTWKAAREIIDWTIKGESIFSRKRPLADNTLRRIWAGLMKYGGKAFVLGQQSGAVARDVDQPIPTVAGAGAISLIEPFILPQFSSGAPRSVDEPVSTITSTSRGIALIEPFLVEYHNGKNSERRTKPITEPLPTLDTSNRFGLVQPFIMPVNHGKDDMRAYSLDVPMPTITSVDAWSFVEPYIVMLNGTSDEAVKASHRPVDQPLPTVTATPHFGLAEPFLIEYYGTGRASSVDEPLKTQTGRDRFGLVEPLIFTHNDKKYLLDIRFRMLQPHELARAMSFPDEYRFHGNREQVVKQIGNAVPVSLAKELCKALLSTEKAN